LTHDECVRLLPAFAAASAVRYPPDQTWNGKARPRQRGGGAKGTVAQREDQRPFLLVSQKTPPLHTLQAGNAG
jgi:hypothetical protein